MKLKRATFKIRAVLMGVSVNVLLFAANAHAYTYITASHTPITLGTASPHNIQNNCASASIDYCTSTSCTGAKQLSVMAVWNPDAGSSSTTFPRTGLYVTDGITTVDVSASAPSSPYWTWKNNPSIWPIGIVPGADVIIGNGTSLTNFKIGVLYASESGLGSNVMVLDEYSVSNPGSSMTVTYLNSYTLSLTSISYGGKIDMIADYNNLLSTGKPKCDKFVATWSDYSGQVGYAASLSSPSSGASVYFSSVVSNQYECDIAGIQRAHPAMLNDDVALCAYFDGTNLLYQEWNITSGGVSAPTTLDVGYHVPRIDAIDNPALQVAGNNNWLVTALNATSGSSIRVYSDAHPSGSLGTIPIATSGSAYGNGQVTIGPGSVYTIGFYDVTTGHVRANTVNFTGTSINPTGYNVTTAPVSNGLIPDLVTVSSTCNTTQYLFAGWPNEPAGTPPTDYYYCKTTANPISFKQPAAISNSDQSANYRVYPNPVINLLTLSGKHNDGDSYSIIDVSGRVVMTGSIISDDQLLNVNNLLNGMYILNIITSDKTQKVQFVKE